MRSETRSRGAHGIWATLAFTALAGLGDAGCGGSTSNLDMDGGPDGTADVGVDVAPPVDVAPRDARMDATHEAGLDVGTDTGADAPVCGAPLVSCAGACVDTSNDPMNCSACGVTCLAGQICTASACTTTCAVGQTVCKPDGGEPDVGAPYCANTKTDNDNCGACGNVCGAGRECQDGQCVNACAGPDGGMETLCTPDGGAPYCASTGSDNDNCGTCGNVCETGALCTGGKCECSAGFVECAGSCCGGVCVAGSCEVTFSDQSEPSSVAADSSYVYWTTFGSGYYGAGGGVFKAPIGGGAVTTLSTADADYPTSIQVTSSTLYWVNEGLSGDLLAVPLKGGKPTTLISGMTEALSVALDSTNAYVADYGADCIVYGPLGGGVTQTLIAELDEPYAITTDGTNVYWAEFGGGTIKEMPVKGGAVTTLATGQDQADSVLVYGSTLYFSTLVHGGSILSVPITGGTPTTLVTGLHHAESIVTDGTSLFYTTFGSGPDYENGTVASVPIAGGTPTIIAKKQNGAAGLAVTPANLCWTDRLGDQVVCLTR